MGIDLSIPDCGVRGALGLEGTLDIPDKEDEAVLWVKDVKARYDVTVLPSDCPTTMTSPFIVIYIDMAGPGATSNITAKVHHDGRVVTTKMLAYERQGDHKIAPPIASRLVFKGKELQNGQLLNKHHVTDQAKLRLEWAPGWLIFIENRLRRQRSSLLMWPQEKLRCALYRHNFPVDVECFTNSQNRSAEASYEWCLLHVESAVQRKEKGLFLDLNDRVGDALVPNAVIEMTRVYRVRVESSKQPRLGRASHTFDGSKILCVKVAEVHSSAVKADGPACQVQETTVPALDDLWGFVANKLWMHTVNHTVSATFRVSLADGTTNYIKFDAKKGQYKVREVADTIIHAEVAETHVIEPRDGTELEQIRNAPSGQNWWFHGDRLWVSHGLDATFLVELKEHRGGKHSEARPPREGACKCPEVR